MKKIDAEYEAYKKKIANPMFSSFTQFAIAG